MITDFSIGGFPLLDYIWLDDKSPILRQLPNNFNAAAIYPNEINPTKVASCKL